MSRQPRFRLDADERPERAVRGAALAQVDYALALLPRADVDAVHETRKVCKKLRSLMRLVRPALGRDYRTGNARLRSAARALSRSRGTAAHVETAERLATIDAALFDPVAIGVRTWRTSDAARPCARAAGLLRQQRDSIQRWKLGKLAPADLVVGAAAGYRRARTALKAVRLRPTAAALHDWRRRAKYHGYQCALMQASWPAAGARVHDLKALSDLLGWHHDLQVLSAALGRRAAGFGGREELRAARARIAAEQRKALHQALRLGKRLFARKPLAWLESPAVSRK